MKVFLFDTAKCSGCFSCQIACKDEHCGNDWSPIAKPQPKTGHFWCKGTQKTHGQIPKVKLEYSVRMCNHCSDCALIKAAPDVVSRREDGLVIIDPEKAAGREDLVDACPYGSVYWNAELSVAQKCTGCAHLVDEGENPRCMDACQTGALRFVEESEVADEIAAAEVLSPESGTGPRMYYLNNPKLFISGDVWDPSENEIIEGAHVTLRAEDGSESTTESDDLGDFWFRFLEPGTYQLSLEADGFAPVTREVKLTESLNVGDFPLEKAAA